MRIAIVACLAASFHPAAASPLTLDDVVEGQTVSQWIDQWWLWLDRFPVDAHPLFDSTGQFQDIHQPGRGVYFLASSPVSVSRTFSIPADRHLLVPLFPWSLTSSVGDPPELVGALLTRLVNDVDDLELSIDGVSVPMAELFSGRHAGGFHGAFPGPFLHEGLDSYTYTDGYWVMLEPLSPGPHTLIFGGRGTGFAPVTVQYESIVTAHISVPEPGLWPVVPLIFGMLVGARRGRAGVRRRACRSVDIP